MNDLATADRMHVHAADCWISIGDLDRARTKLNEITPAARDHPAVHEVRWHLCALARDWDTCLEVATLLIQATPEHPSGWIHLASALRRFKKYGEAIRVLRQGIETCGETPFLLNLACCYSRLRKHLEAAKCLKRASDLAGDQPARHRLLLMAFDEPDLEPMWEADDGSLVECCLTPARPRAQR